MGYEDLLEHPGEDPMLNSQLLLVFGTLADKGSEDVENHVMDNLRVRTFAITSQASRDIIETKVLLHALGNTGSKMSISLIMSILNTTSMEDYGDVQLIVIEAFLKAYRHPYCLGSIGEFLGRRFISGCYHRNTL